MIKNIRPCNNNFAIDSDLIKDISKNWTAYRLHDRTTDNVEHFRKILDGSVNKIEKMFYVCENEDKRKNLNVFFDNNLIDNPSVEVEDFKRNKFYHTCALNKDPNQGLVKEFKNQTTDYFEKNSFTEGNWDIAFGDKSFQSFFNISCNKNATFIEKDEIFNKMQYLEKDFFHEKGEFLSFEDFLSKEGNFNPNWHTPFIIIYDPYLFNIKSSAQITNQHGTKTQTEDMLFACASTTKRKKYKIIKNKKYDQKEVFYCFLARTSPLIELILPINVDENNTIEDALNKINSSDVISFAKGGELMMLNDELLMDDKTKNCVKNFKENIPSEIRDDRYKKMINDLKGNNTFIEDVMKEKLLNVKDENGSRLIKNIITSREFDELNKRLSFYLKWIDSVCKDENNNIYVKLFGSSKSATADGKTEKKYYMQLLRYRIYVLEQISEKSSEELNELKSLKLIQKFTDSLETINFQNKFPITNNDHDRSILTSYAKMEFGKGYSLFKPRVLFSNSKAEISSQSKQSVSTVFESSYKRKFDVNGNEIKVSNFDSLTRYYDDVSSTIKNN